MESKGLLFIPDISGFTRFVNETEIDHSRLIIEELLEILIDANEIGLEVSEIEGDAILFYKYGESPGVQEIYQQVADMFRRFHQALISYDYRKYCQCKACMAAVDLSLKIITHYGEFTGYNVRNFNKLIGKDVIVAHQLLKNDIPQHEYWLVTKNLVPDNPPEDLAQWIQWNSSSKQTETGEIPFHYAQLSPLKKEINTKPPARPDLSKKAKMLSVSRDYATDVITLFHACGDFNFRSQWEEGVEKVEEVGHFLPRVGMRCRFVMKNGEATIYSSSYSYGTEKIEFTETNEGNDSLRNFILENQGNNKVRLTIEFYLRKNPVRQYLFNLFRKKKMEESLQRSLSNLEEVVKEIKLPANID